MSAFSNRIVGLLSVSLQYALILFYRGCGCALYSGGDTPLGPWHV